MGQNLHSKKLFVELATFQYLTSEHNYDCVMHRSSIIYIVNNCKARRDPSSPHTKYNTCARSIQGIIYRVYATNAGLDECFTSLL